MTDAAIRYLLRAAIGLVFCAGVASAESLQNTSRFGVDMRAGPGLQFAMIHVLDPSEVAERGRCDLDGAWCLLSTGAKVGWVDTRGLILVRPGGAVQGGPIRPLTTSPIESTTLDGTVPGGAGSRPLPGAIMDAVNGTVDALRVDPFTARPPLIFATDVAFRNVTDGIVNLRAGPGTDTAVLGDLAPGQGGRIDVCDLAQRWCRMAVEGGPVAWVKMTLMGLRRHEVAPMAPGDVALR